MTKAGHTCPLCSAVQTTAVHRDSHREYVLCGACRLIFVPQEYHISRQAEKQRYDLHENDPEDTGYRAFLCKLIMPLLAEVVPGNHGLDFGCGPKPALAAIMAEYGFRLANYDPYYYPDPEILQQCYDFIACSETVEHFRAPREEWQRFPSLLNNGGLLAVMTSLYTDPDTFAGWRYKDDRTHVAFYAPETMQWLAERFNMHLRFHSDTVCFFANKAE